MNIAIGSDHAGFHYKEKISQMLSEEGVNVLDKGTFSENSVDYPDFAHPVADLVATEEAKFGVLVCGSGNGVCMTANKHQDIRAALCWTVEIAKLARQHNNANIICIPARFTSEDQALKMVKEFISTEFEAGRHQRRVNKITCS